MNKTIKIVFVILIMMLQSAYAWTIGEKGRTLGPAIHTTYFLTPNNQAFPVQGQAYAGVFINGTCIYSVVYTIGTITLKTGNVVDIDAYALKQLIGPGFNCVTLSYTHNQTVKETFLLYTDGINYITTNPPTAEVSIL